MQVNVILGNLLRLHYLGIVVTSDGHHIPMTRWRDYALSPNARHGNGLGVVRNAFWVSSYIFISFATSCKI
jgi:hypothetical protein